MIHRTVRSLFYLCGVACLGLSVLVAAIAVRLHQGPIALDFLSPFIETALTQGDLSVSLDTTVLALGQDDRLVEIRAINVNAYVGEAETPLISVPEMALTLSARALLNGEIAPKSVFLYKPRLTLLRDDDGHVQWSMGENEPAAPAVPAEPQSADAPQNLSTLLAALIGDPAPGQPGRHLNRAAILNADVRLIDHKTGLTWRLPSADAEIWRISRGLLGRIRLDMDMNGQLGAIQMRGSFDKITQDIDADMIFSGLRPASFAALHPILQPLKAADFALAGHVQGRGNLTGGMDSAEFEISGGEGMLAVPAPVNLTRKIEGLSLRGRVGQHLSHMQLEDFSLDVGNGTRVQLTASGDELDHDAVIKLQASAHHVAFDDLPQLWPAIVAPNAREWVVANLSKGIVHEAHARVELHLPGNDPDHLVVNHVSGDMHGEGAVVNYLRPMPVVKNGVASVTFNADEFRIQVKNGELYGLKVNDGTIILGGLSAPDQFADIDLSITGPVPDALKLIDSKPLRYAQALGIDPTAVSGQAVARLKLKFPLLKNLRLEEVEVKAIAKTRDVSLPKVALGQDLTHGDLDLEVDAKGLDASGPVQLGGIAADLKWRENFVVRNAPFRSRYQLQAKSVDEAQRKALGLDGPPFVAPFLSGPVATAVEVKLYGGGKGDIDAKVDLSPAAMQLPGLGWRKEPRTSGRAEVSVHLEKLKLDSIPRFDVTAGDLTTRGSVAFDADGTARRVDFSRLAYGGRTDLEGSLSLRRSGGMDVVAHGKAFNAEPVLGNGDSGMVEGEAPANPHQKADLPPMSVALTVKELWLSKPGKLTETNLTLERDGDNWHTMQLKGQVGNGGWFQLQMHPGSHKTRLVKITSNDAGAVLRSFDVYDHMVGGTLDVDGTYDDNRDSQPLNGTVHITDYHIVNAPTLARLLTVAALTGIVDVLQGQGIGFSNLDAPFVLNDGLLKIKSARAWGTALGLTSSGEIDMDHGRMAIEGTVVPAYMINSALGDLPVIGWLVTGGEKGGGLVAFNYNMRGSTQEPSVSVNPLSAFTPGFLRNLFNIFDDGSETEARKHAPESKP